MSVGFGFSVGDFVAALELVGEVIDALRESGQASGEYRELLRQLYSLETALLQVKRLEYDDCQQGELIALRQAAAQCQYTIDAFRNKARSYEPHLWQHGYQSSTLKRGWKKIKWSLFKKDEIVKFKADLMAHTQAIQLLLSVLQMRSMSFQSQEQKKNNRTMAGQIHDLYCNLMRKFTTLSESLTTGVDQINRLFHTSHEILRVTVNIFQLVLETHRVVTQIPGQIQRQRPVTLIDALGRECPFHLEFIRSAEAFVSVLIANFGKVGAADKVRNGEFVLEDAGTRKDIDLSMDWDLCFSPGQRVEMSMIFFRKELTEGTSCPRCQTLCKKGQCQDTKCLACGMLFRRVVELGIGSPRTPNTPSPLIPKPSVDLKRKGHEPDDEMRLFRKVRIHSQRLSQLWCQDFQ